MEAINSKPRKSKYKTENIKAMWNPLDGNGRCGAVNVDGFGESMEEAAVNFVIIVLPSIRPYFSDCCFRTRSDFVELTRIIFAFVFI